MITKGRRIVRYAFRERMIHSTAALSYVYLLLTGLAFWTPYALLARDRPRWRLFLADDAPVGRTRLHGRGRLDVRRMAPRHEDGAGRSRVARGDGASTSATRTPRCRAVGRFNYGQKMLFWVMALGGLALLVSGLVLWFVDSIPWELRVDSLRGDARSTPSRRSSRSARSSFISTWDSSSCPAAERRFSTARSARNGRGRIIRSGSPA